MPRLTIGMPVYNGELFIREAIDAVLAQTFTDFELVIADNASTDATPEIIAEYTAADPRIRCVRHERNLGSAGNHNYLIEQTTTPLFKWAAADDLHAPTHVEHCIALLDERPELIGAHTRTMRIDEDSRLIKPEKYHIHTDGPSPHVRFRNVIAKPHSCFQCFAVFRTDVVEKTAGMQPYPGSDRVFLAEVALHGPTAEFPEYLLFRRVHSGSHSADPDVDQADKVHFWKGDVPEGTTDDGNDGSDAGTSESVNGELAVPHLHTEYLELTDKVPLEADERRRCRREVTITHTAAQLRSMIMRSIVYPVRKWMNARKADRIEAGPPPPEPPLWTEYIDQAASGD
jgi:hypothetical protein